jgi:hypothetical protein
MTDLTCVAWGKRSPSFSAWAAIVLGVGLAVAPTLALAEAQVRGNPRAVTVEANNASVEEILVALADAFNVQFRSSANLEKRLTGTYQGTLQQVVTHVLRGYNFVVKSGESGVEVTLLGPGKAFVVVGASPSKVAETRADAAAEPSPAATPEERPAPIASSGGPIPIITKLAEGPRPMPSASDSAPSPVPGPARGSAPMLVPMAPGSTPPVPVPGSSAALPPPIAVTTPAAPPSAR